MSKQFTPKPTDAELEILQVLWENGPSSVRFVNDKLNDKRGDEEREIGYTTTLKLMQIMVEKKGIATRNTDNRTHIYSANVDESNTKQALLKSFVDTTFRGSAMNLVLQALGNHQTSSDELAEIKALIDKIEKEGK